MHRALSLLLFVVVTTVAAPAFGQPSKYRAPSTEGGQPDLQGVWNFNSGVPLQRPAAFSDKKSITKEEFDKQRAMIRNGLSAIAKFAPVEAVGLDWIDNAPPVEDLRTSLITYPEERPAAGAGQRRAAHAGIRRTVRGTRQSSIKFGTGAVCAVSPSSFGGGVKDSYTDFMMSERCLIDADVPLVPQLDDNYLQIIQGSDHVVLLTDVSRRIVALGGRPPVGDQRAAVDRHFHGPVGRRNAGRHHQEFRLIARQALLVRRTHAPKSSRSALLARRTTGSNTRPRSSIRRRSRTGSSCRSRWPRPGPRRRSSKARVMKATTACATHSRLRVSTTE